MHEQRVARLYFRELVFSFAVYVVLLVAAILLGRPMAEGALRTVVLASPMIGFALMIRAIARQIGRIDEYLRQRLLENVALAAAITAALSFTYGFLETAGYPRLSMFAVWMVMGGAFGAVAIVRGLRER